MCGPKTCMYYGCDNCSKWLPEVVTKLRRDECACCGELFKEFCDMECLLAYVSFICDCGAGMTQVHEITTGNSDK